MNPKLPATSPNSSQDTSQDASQDAPLSARYELLEELGRGSSAVTHRARRRSDGVEVAMKILDLSRLQDWKTLELFEREARALAGLKLEGVPELFEYGEEDQDGGPRFFLVQELIPGRSIAQMMGDGVRFLEEEVIDIGTQILRILEALHARHPPIVHRDIKPGNIILRPNGRCALVDFGAVTDTLRRGEGGETVAGTFGYMPPEQLHGRALPSSDLYGLGATMVHMLSGCSPADMEVEVFRLKFQPHIHVTGGLLLLLEGLLEPDERDRISSATDARAVLENLVSTDHNEVAGGSETALCVVTSLRELKSIGQSGSLSLFHAMPAEARRVPALYRRQLFKHASLWILGGAAVITFLVFEVLGGGNIVGLGPLEMLLVFLLALALSIGGARKDLRLYRLLRRGRKAEGRVIAKRSGAEGSTILVYEFEVRGQKQRGEVKIQNAEVEVEVEGKIGVVVSLEDPSFSVPYPVPAATLPHLLED